MRSAVLIGTDFAYDSKGKLIPLEINTNVGWDTVNRKESVDEIFDFTDLSMYVRENAIKEILLEGKIAEICKDAIQKAIPHVTVSEATMGDYEEEHPNTTLFVRTAWSSQAFVDTFAASKEKFKSLIKSEDFCEAFSEPSGNLPNLVVKAIDPQYDRLEYPKFYKADVSVLKVPHGFIVEPAVLNVDNLVEGRIPVFRNWSLFVAGENGDKIDTIYLGTYTKVCGDEFDESKLKYNSDGALVEGRGMLLSLDGLSTQWPADALVEASDEVLMSDGSWKKASELKVGDKVKSLQFEDSLDIRHHVGQLTTTEKELKKSFAVATVDFLTRTRGYRDFVEIKFNDKSDWFDTANSSYLVKRESGLEFDYISNLRKGDVVYFLKDGSKLATKTVESTGTVRKYVDTYNVGLAENHVFFSRGEGETGAFASLEHNDDTEDCNLDPKSQNGAFQTFISFDGTEAAKGTLNISTSGVLVSSESTAKTFAKTSGTASANGEYVNPNEYSSDKGGFTGCWYPLAGNSTWNVSVPLTVVDGVKSVATIVRLGSADGNALNGSNTYWKFTEIGSTGSNVLWPVTFSSATGPCKLHVQVYQPSDIIQVTEPTGKNFEADGTLTSGDSTTTLTFAQGVGIKGSITGSVRFSKDYISFSSRSANIAEDGTIDTAKISETTAKFKTSMSKNTGFTERVGSVSTYIGPKSSEGLVGRYSVIQAAIKPTLAVEVNSPGGDVILPDSYDTDYVLQSYEVSVTSNAPWKVTTVSADGNFSVSKQVGQGNGSFDIAEVSSSVKEYSYSKSETYEVGSVIISTNTDTKNDVSYTIPVYRLKKRFVAPAFLSSSNINGVRVYSTQLCLPEYYADNELSFGDIIYQDDDTGTSQWKDVSNCQRIQSNHGTVESPSLADDEGYTFVDCVPVSIRADLSGVQDMTLSVSSDLDQEGFSYGFAELGFAGSDVLYGRYLPYVYNTIPLTLEQQVTISGSVYPGDALFSTTENSKTADNLCLVIGTEQLSDASHINGTVNIDLVLEYTDLVDGKQKQVEKTFIIGERPLIDVQYEERSWSSFVQMWDNLPSHSFQSTITLSGLQDSVRYRLVASPGITIDFDGENLLNVDYDGSDWMNFQQMWEAEGYPIVSVPENNSSTTRYRAIALVPAESTITVLPEPTEYGDLCLDGKYYSYMVAAQNEKVEAKKLNSVEVVCNVREVTWTQTDEMAAAGKRYQINALYDVTASASSPVSSSVSFTLTPKPTGNVNTGEGPYGTGNASVTIGSGNSVTTDAPGGFGYAYYGNNVSDGDPMPSVGTLGVSAILPTVDSVFEYEIGSVRVRNIPSLGGPDTLVITDFSDRSTERQIMVSSYSLSGLGYEVSCSGGLTGSIISFSNRSDVVFTTGSRIVLGSLCTVSLRRNGKEISRRTVQAGAGPVFVETLKASPSAIVKDLGAFTETVVLYTGSSVPSTGLSASVITSSSAWIGVARKLSKYLISVSTEASASRSGSITFKVDNVGTVTVPVTQSATDKTLYVWYCPNGASEVQLGSRNISFNSESAFSVVGNNYDYRFRYENASGGTFMPVFDKATENGTAVRILGNFSTELGDSISDTSGNFFLRVEGVSSPNTSAYALGTLSFNTKNLKIPSPTIVNSSVR